MRDSELFKTSLKTNGVQPHGWSLLAGPPPHKIFLWDSCGTYLDCEFPNPFHGHFLGGAALRGKNINKVLPQKDSEALLRAIRQALASHKPTFVRLDMAFAQKQYQSLIRLLPMQEFVMGWVNDFPMSLYRRAMPQTNHQEFERIPEVLTSREKEIALLITKNHSNEAISLLLNISQRTVKFHVSHVLEKLQATSRAQVKVIITLLHQA